MAELPLDPQAFQNTKSLYENYYAKAKKDAQVGGRSALRAQIGKLDVSIASMESTLNTKKSLPNIILSLSSVFVAGTALFFNFFNRIIMPVDMAATLKNLLGSEADQYIQRLDIQLIVEQMVSQNETIQLWTYLVGGTLIAAILVSMGMLVVGTNKKKRELDICRIQRAAYQQLLDEMVIDALALPTANYGDSAPVAEVMEPVGEKTEAVME